MFVSQNYIGKSLHTREKVDGQTFYSVDNQCIIKWGGWFLKLAETKSLTPYVFHPILGGIRLPESLHLSQAVK